MAIGSLLSKGLPVFIFFAFALGEDISQLPDLINEASGKFTLQQPSPAIALSANDFTLLGKLAKNLNSIGLRVNPEDFHKLSDEGVASLASKSGFLLSFEPDSSSNGGFVKPKRRITEDESKKLQGVLNHFRDIGIVVNVSKV